MKRRAATQASRPKKVKLAKTQQSQSQSQLSQEWDDIIEVVAAQGEGADAEGRKTAVETTVEAVAAVEDVSALGDSLLHTAISACNNMRAEMAKLNRTIKQQQKRISDIESAVARILTLVQQSVEAHPGHPNQPPTTKPSKKYGRKAGAGSAPAPAPVSVASGSSSGSSPQRHPSSAGGPEVGRSWSEVTGRRRGRRPDADQQHAGDSGRDDDNYDGHFTMIVHRTLNDVSRRKKNVVVTGLEESTSSSDQDLFEAFCESWMPIKPPLAAGNSCVRIGKSTDGRPRRLLVRLRSVEAADVLLQAAPSLQNCGNDYVEKNVFINADLSPSEAKLAFEARKKRREGRLRRSEAAAAAGAATMDQSSGGGSGGSSSGRQPPGMPHDSGTSSSVDQLSSISGSTSPTRTAVGSQSQPSGGGIGTKPLNVDAAAWTGNAAVHPLAGASTSSSSAPAAAAPGGGPPGGAPPSPPSDSASSFP